MPNINYKSQTIMTEPKEFKDEYSALPDSIHELIKCVQGLVIYGEHSNLYEINFKKTHTDEELVRTASQMITKIKNISKSPIIIKREASERMVGMSRHFAVLLTSFLRYKGYEARICVGFADYLESKVPFTDHWIVEYFHIEKKKWIQIDPILDDIHLSHFDIQFNPEDLSIEDGFFSGANAWKMCRQGLKHPEDFGYNVNWKGWQALKGNLLHDFNCKIGIELSPWDLWSDLSQKKYNQLSKQEKEFLDELADVLSSKEFNINELVNLKKRLPEEYFSSIDSQLKLLGITQSNNWINPKNLQTQFKIKPANKNDKIISSQNDSTIIHLTGAKQNNLKNIDVDIPKNKFTVVSGVSGSGKSSLVFDTLYQEGKRRYFENINTGSKINEQIIKPDFDSLQGLSPVIAIEQKKGSQNPRSTLGSISGIWDYLRMLFVGIGESYCPYCGEKLEFESTTKNSCPSCKTDFQKLTTSMFNSNTHIGSCQDCNGLGYTYEIDVSKIITDPSKSILDGATSYWGKLRGKKITGNWMVGEMYAVAKEENIDLNTPWNNLPKSFIQHILYGTGEKIYEFDYQSNGRTAKIRRPASGAINHIQRLFRDSASVSNNYLQYMSEKSCDTCEGELLRVEARFTVIYGFRFPELINFTIQEMYDWIVSLKKKLSKSEYSIAQDILFELGTKLNNLLKVGLHYLSTKRSAPTLSGGELQRARLSNQLGSDLVGITYILDEPSIGLHPRDNHLIIETIKGLRDNGNTVIVVEHDKETILAADYLIDIGPQAGSKGGQLIAQGSIHELLENPNSVTAPYLQDNDDGTHYQHVRQPITKWIELRGCTANNLKNIDVDIPLECICTVTGVSGSGKSSLIFQSLVPALNHSLNDKNAKSNGFKTINGINQLSDYILMDQTPIGKSIRSTIATYVTIFDDIRTIFSKTKEAIYLELDESYFSFNSKKGQCPNCQGIGKIKITLPYMADQWVTCTECSGKRYLNQILSVTYQGKTINDVLNMEVASAIEFFKNHENIHRKLSILADIGLGYLTLGQSTISLSGGESQRLKLTKEISEKTKGSTLYILDEPTTGLHFKDIKKLQIAFKKLTEEGHSVLIIEHNTDIINDSDWIIDIGPESGVYGGEVVASGTPEQIKENKKSITGRYL